MGEVSILREIKSLVCTPHWRYPRRKRCEWKPQETQFSLPIPKSPWSRLTQGWCSCRGAFQMLSGTGSEDFCPNQGNLIAQQFKKEILDFSHTINSPYIIVEKNIRKARLLWMKRNWTQLESSHHRCDFQNFPCSSYISHMRCLRTEYKSTWWHSVRGLQAGSNCAHCH